MKSTALVIKTIEEIIMDIRFKLELTQAQFAALIGKCRSLVSKWENGAAAITPTDVVAVSDAAVDEEDSRMLLKTYCVRCVIRAAIKRRGFGGPRPAI